MADSEITSAAQSKQGLPPSSMEGQPPAILDKTTGVSFSIWPPTQRTRDAVINRLIETLSTPSVLSKRYGTIPADEADAAARKIEEEAFATAGGSSAAAEDDGLGILQVYSKEISKLMLETVKARATSASSADNGATETATAATDGAPTAESESWAWTSFADYKWIRVSGTLECSHWGFIWYTVIEIYM